MGGLFSSMNRTVSFEYGDIPFDPTTQIRLLTLFPSDGSASNDGKQDFNQIQTSLTCYDWDQKPPYIALSYTWGDAKQLKTITVHGKPLQITANLYDALLHMKTSKPVTVWIDAICINQKDDHEKTEQVKRMTDIYKAASSVYAWLGPATDDSDAAMDGIERIGTEAIEAGQLRLARETMLKLWDPDPEGLLSSVRQPFIDLSKSIGLDYSQAAIKSLSERGYFTRTWIVQEFSVATELVIVCGKKKLTWPQFCAAFIYLGMHRVLTVERLSAIPEEVDPTAKDKLKKFIKGDESGAPSRLIGSRNRWQKQRPDYHSSMLELLSLVSGHTHATDPRDRIFGLLGVAPDAATLGIKVDYRRSVQDVYQDAARALITNNFTDVLSWCRTRAKSKIPLPTWVPDFSAPLLEPLGSFKNRGPPSKPLFNASGTNEVKVSASDKPGQLTMSGIIVDTIEMVGTAWKRENCQETATLLDLSLDTLLGQIHTACKLAQDKTPPISSDPKFWEEALWRIPCADQQWHEYARRRADSAAVAGLLEIIARNAGERSGYRDEVKKKAWSKYHLAMECLYDFKPFLSDKGYVGMAPEFAEEGDLICTIYGVIVPYVLRKVEGGFELVGESYVVGIMDGEALGMELEEQEFCLV